MEDSFRCYGESEEPIRIKKNLFNKEKYGQDAFSETMMTNFDDEL